MIYHVEESVVEVHDLTVAYEKKPVLWGIDLTLPAGQLIGIVGPNGAGKSTLIKAIMGLVPHTGGYIKIFGKDFEEVRKRVSYVPQRESVDWDFPASVMDVVLMGRYGKLGLFKRPRKSDREAALESLRKVGLEQYGNRQISQLSGGQQQRVFLARALAQQADIYFMDEPFAGVDAATEKTILKILQDISAQGKSVIVVHHDLQSVQNYFNWVVMLNLRLTGSGPTEKVFTDDLLQETYGGKLSILSKVSNLMKQQQHPQRETELKK